MKRLVLISATALLIGAGLFRLLAHDPGYVLIVLGGKSVEMRFWFALVMFILLVAACMWLVKGGLQLLRFIRGGWRSLRHERSLRVDHRLQTGILRLLEGDYQSADKLLNRAAKEMPDNILAAVASSESALRLGNRQDAHARLQRRVPFTGEKAISLALADIKVLMAEKQYDEALSRILVLKTRSPNNPSLLQILQKLLVELRDWPALEGLLNEFDRSDVVEPSRWRSLQVLTYRELLIHSGEQTDPLAAVDSVWQRVPRALKTDSEIVAVYCRLLMGFDQHFGLEPILRNAIKHHWNDELVELYGLIGSDDPAVQLRTAQQWLETHADNAVLLLSLGRISLRNQLWGQARDYFADSLRLQPVPVAFAELARLIARLGDHAQSTDLYRQGLLQLAPQLPNLPMPAKTRTP